MLHSLSLAFTEMKMLPCLNKQLFGIDCPGCGLQRAFIFLLDGDFIEAFMMYPAIYPLMLLMTFIFLDQMVRFKYANKIIIILAVTSVASILINYILKFI